MNPDRWRVFAGLGRGDDQCGVVIVARPTYCNEGPNECIVANGQRELEKLCTEYEEAYPPVAHTPIPTPERYRP